MQVAWSQPLALLGAGVVLGVAITKLTNGSSPPIATVSTTTSTTSTSTISTISTISTTATTPAATVPENMTTTVAPPATPTITPAAVATLAISDPPLLRFQRFGKNELLLGIEHTRRIFQSRVLVMGTGGVGSWVVESLARAGVGFLVLVDPGLVKISNCSQQIPALSSTIGRHKVQVLAERIREINPDCEVVPYPSSADETTVDGILSQFWPLDVVIDCADKIADKVAMMAAAHRKGVPCIVTTLGAATRLDPAQVRVVDVSQTSHCPVGKQVRKGLLARGIRSGVTCVYSLERPRNRFMTSSDRMVDLAISSSPSSSSSSSSPSPQSRSWTPSPMGSWVVVPAMFGLYAAHHALMFIGGEGKETSRTEPGPLPEQAVGGDNERDLEVPWPHLDIPSHGFAHRRQQQLQQLETDSKQSITTTTTTTTTTSS